MFGSHVRETATTTGTGDFTLAGASTGFVTCNSVFSNHTTDCGIPFQYEIQSQGGTQWEKGIGHLSASTTLVRDVIESNSSGTTTALNFSAGTKYVFCSPMGRGLIPTMPTLNTSANKRYMPSLVQPPIPVSGQAGYNDTIYYSPILLATSDSIDAIVFHVAGSFAGSFICGLYTMDPTTGKPGRKIVSGSVVTPSSNALQESTFSGRYVPPGWYFAAISSSAATGSVQISSYAPTTAFPMHFLGFNGILSAPFVALFESTAYTGTLPTTPGSLSGASGFGPCMAVRVS